MRLFRRRRPVVLVERVPYESPKPVDRVCECGVQLPTPRRPLFSRHVCGCGCLYWVNLVGAFVGDPPIGWELSDEETYRQQLGGAMRTMAEATGGLVSSHSLEMLSESGDRESAT